MIYISTNSRNSAQFANGHFITSPGGGIYSISRNYMSAAPSSDTSQGESTLIGFSSITNANVDTNFQFHIDGNTFDGYGRHSAIHAPKAVFGGRSLLSIVNNSFTSNGATVGLRIVINPSTIAGESLLRIDTNTFLSPQGAARAHAITLMDPFCL